MLISPPAVEREIYSVAQLNQSARELLERSFPLIWVEGEISNLSRPLSGHLYFSLKDSKAQVRCALFRNRATLLQKSLANGQKVLVRAQISLYEPRGDFQLLIERLEELGDGALRRAYDELRIRLAQEGLFDSQHKRPLPRFPARIGVITSSSGAAIRDVLSILRRRFPSIAILIYPVLVQGKGAGEQIARTITLAAERAECDVLLLVRGGGSLEDLWAFNEEVVARAIHACSIPLVNGVGHETDVTIADFAADLRAPTPSAAAELVSPDRLAWLSQFTLLESRLEQAMQRRLATAGQALTGQEQRLLRLHPARRLHERAQRLDELEQRLRHALTIRLQRLDAHLNGLAARLYAQAPRPRIQHLQHRHTALAMRLTAAMRRHLQQHRQRLAAASRALHALSPLPTLGRGYAIVRRYPQGELLRQARQVQIGEPVEAVLSEGRLICEVKQIQDGGIE